MTKLDDGTAARAASATGTAGAAVSAGKSVKEGTSGAAGDTSVVVSGAGDTGATGATGTANATTPIGSAAVTGAALTTGTTYDTSTTGDTGAAADAVTAYTTGAVGAKDKDKNQETKANIVLPPPTSTLAKEIPKNPLEEKCGIADHIHTLFLQYSQYLTQLDDTYNKPVVGIINMPKSSTIRFLHSFGSGKNPIGGSSPIAGKILSLVSNSYSKNPPQDMVLLREIFHKTSIRLPTQEAFDIKIIN